MTDLSDIEVVVFDAVGTLIYPTPSVADAYRRALSIHCGVDVAPSEINTRLAAALSDRSASDDLRTDETAEQNFWAGLILSFCTDDHGFRACFDDLYQHFAAPSSWRCFDDVAEPLHNLQKRGVRLALASNFDRRLHTVCDGMSDLAAIDCRLISSEVGWRKPAGQFFEAIQQTLGCAANSILMVGDDLTNDVAGALSAGMQAALIDRQGSTTVVPDAALCLSSLHQLMTIDGLHSRPRRAS